MTRRATVHLDEVLTRDLDYFRQEYSLTYSELLGVLAIITARVAKEAMDAEAEDEDEDD